PAIIFFTGDDSPSSLGRKLRPSIISAWEIPPQTEGDELLRIEHHRSEADTLRFERINFGANFLLPLLECLRKLVPVNHDCDNNPRKACSGQPRSRGHEHKAGDSAGQPSGDYA